jgi:hypothetical protein
MKQLFFLFGFVLLAIYSNAQDINSVFTGISIDTADVDQYIKKLNRDINGNYMTDFITINETPQDSLIIVFYSIRNDFYEQNSVFVIYDTKTKYLEKAIAIPSKMGLLTINKNYLKPGYFKLLIEGSQSLSKSFSVIKDYNQKKQIGNYMIYWKETHFETGFVGY